MIIHTPDPNTSWGKALKDEYTKPYYIKLWKRIYADLSSRNVLPNFDVIFRALNEGSVNKTRVLILGQDPYPTRGKAIGRAFGVPKDYHKINSSLQNILQHVMVDVGREVKDITFKSWADQGVLLLNTRLTVVEGKPMSHAGIGWEQFIEAVLQILNNSYSPGVALLWGAEARKMGKLLPNWHKLEASHPCKFSAWRSFNTCRHFTKANEELERRGLKPIDWVR